MTSKAIQHSITILELFLLFLSEKSAWYLNAQ